MSLAMQHLRQTLGENLAPEQADAQARELAGAKSGPSHPRSYPQSAADVTGEMGRGEIMAKLGLKHEKHFREHYQQPGIS